MCELCGVVRVCVCVVDLQYYFHYVEHTGRSHFSLFSVSALLYSETGASKKINILRIQV